MSAAIPPRERNIVIAYGPARRAAFDKLKVCVTLLVVLHHSILAYARFGHFDTRHYLRSSAPIVDPARWVGFDVLVDFNDVYFMSLMFLISGLFVMPSLSRHGPWHYLAGRAVRLGLPFLVAVTVIMPVAYYPSFLQTGANLSFPQYWSGYFTTYGWPGGPAWFIWVLLLFDIAAVSLACLWPNLPRTIATVPDWLTRRPYAGLGLALAATAAAYMPILYAFGPTRWFAWGPFAVQASRVLLYASFFAAGVILGAAGLRHELLERTGPVARAWAMYAGLTVTAFGGLVAVQIAGLRNAPLAATLWWQALGAALFVLICVLASVALIGGFVRHLDANRRWLELLAPCAFGIYVLHYAPLTWMQTALLTVAIPAVVKAGIVFAITLAVSWSVVAGLRLNRILRQIL
jgi:glucan biosynthesis protein C